MPDEKGELREINYRQLLPWTEIFRTFKIALDIRKLLLAAAAILVTSLGWWLLAMVFGSPKEPARADARYSIESIREADESEEAARARARQMYLRDYAQYEFLVKKTDAYKAGPWDRPRGQNPFLVVKDHSDQLLTLNFWRSQVPFLWEPLAAFIDPVRMLLDPDASLSSTAFAVLGMLVTLATWGFFGGAITRMAAVQVANKDRIGIAEALKFSASKFLSFFGAPLFPFLGILIISVFMIVGGLLFAIPAVGDFLGALLWPLALIGGFIMALLLIGLAGWPMMYATISTEGSDSFHAISNSYSYVFQRPWHYLFYVLVSLIYGVLVIFFVVFITSLFVYLAKWAVGLTPFLGFRDTGDPVSALFVYAPTSYQWRELLTQPHGASTLESMMWGPQKFAAAIVGFWLGLVFLLMIAFAYSFFWTASTILYFLLRKKVDDTDLDEVYLEEEEEESYSVPSATPQPAATSAVSSTLPMAESPGGAPPSPGV